MIGILSLGQILKRERVGSPPLEDRKIRDIFAKLDGAIKIAVQSKKPKADALVKWLTKNGVEKIQEEHQQVTTDRDDQLPAFQYNKVALQAQREVYQAQLHRYRTTCTIFLSIVVSLMQGIQVKAT